MAVAIAVGVSDELDPVDAFASAGEQAARELGAPCDLAVIFASQGHLAAGAAVLEAVHAQLAPRNLIGCGAGGVVGLGRELEASPGAVVWALAAPEAEIATYRSTATPAAGRFEFHGLPASDSAVDTMLALADPYTYPAEILLEHLNSERPGIPVLGGLASAVGDGGSLFCDGDLVAGGAVLCTLAGIEVLPCVSQGAEPVGPEMTITACEGNVIQELASVPALERLREAIFELEERERELAASGLLLGIVIDENQPEYVRGDFLVRPIVGADDESGAIATGERVRVGQTVRVHVRDPARADEDLREALRLQSAAVGEAGAAGALLFTCNGRGRRMFDVPDHDAGAVEDALAVPTGGFFCAGEIGPVGGRNFLHGFTATMAIFPT
jgi:small ligand-binding sensory domain FIST